MSEMFLHFADGDFGGALFGKTIDAGADRGEGDAADV